MAGIFYGEKLTDIFFHKARSFNDLAIIVRSWCFYLNIIGLLLNSLVFLSKLLLVGKYYKQSYPHVEGQFGSLYVDLS